MKKLLLTLTGVSMIMTALMAQADMEVCAGKPYTLTNAKPAEGAEPITYQWFENSSPIGSGTPELTVAEGRPVAGEYKYVRVASNAACTLSSNTYTVRVLPAPDPPVMAGSSSYCTSGTITATAGNGGTGIRWDDGSTASLRTVSTTGANTYRAVTTSATGCTSSTATITVTVRQPGADGQAPDATCSCAEGLSDCAGKCQATSGMLPWGEFGISYVSAVPAECGIKMNHYTAAAICTAKNMRLPNDGELANMYTRRSAIPGNHMGDMYWSSLISPVTTSQAWASSTGASYGKYASRTTSYWVKCVK
jgi:hypothetical protein